MKRIIGMEKMKKGQLKRREEVEVEAVPRGEWSPSSAGDSAEAIAKVVRDMKKGNIYIHSHDESSELVQTNLDTFKLAQWADVIDATPVWDQWMGKEGGEFVYEDHRVCPPWENALVSYVNGFGNVTVMSARAIDITDRDDAKDDYGVFHVTYWESLADTHTIDWDRVRWVLHVAVYMGGRGQGEAVRTQGPLHCWRIAVYPDGEIADINWIQVRPDLDLNMWDTAMMVLLDTYNLCNCVNVVIAEPDRPRAQRKRLLRAGVKVNEIHIKPVSRSYRGNGTPLSQFPSSPLTAVRGHTARYGPKYGRGLLFGKYEGSFWIPQHVRGSELFGVSEKEYVADP